MKAVFEVYNPYHRRWFTVNDMESYYLFTETLGYRGRCNKGIPEPDDNITSSTDHSSPAEVRPPV